MNAGTHFDDATAGIVRRAAEQAARRLGPGGRGLEDIVQDFWAVLCRARLRHDPAVLAWHSFVHIVLEHAARDLLRRRSASFRIEQRLREGRKRSAHSPDGSVEAASAPDQRRAAADLRLSLREFAASLSPLQRRILDELGDRKPADAARRLGIPNSTLHAHLKRIRQRAVAAGLGDSA